MLTIKIIGHSENM